MAFDRAEIQDPSPQHVIHAEGPLREFNRAGILAAADVHVAKQLGELGGVTDETVLLAIALAVRAPRQGHLFIDLERVAMTTTPEAAEDEATAPAQSDPLSSLNWPDPRSWRAALMTAATLVSVEPETSSGTDPGSGTNASSGTNTGLGTERHPSRPLHLAGNRLYLDRYWQAEHQLATALQAFADQPPRSDDHGLLGELIATLVDQNSHDQRRALEIAATRGLCVIAGGPGSGKTTSLVRLLALLYERWQAEHRSAPAVALCAPTGRAAARLSETISSDLPHLRIDSALAQPVSQLRATTIHRLLGWQPGDRFRHDSTNPLPHDVVIVDECSMVSLTLMCQLLDAVRSGAQVVLVGDPDQLTAVEAGAVLRDIVGPETNSETTTHAIDGCVVRLRHSHRFGAKIGELADAIRRGDADEVIDLLADARGGHDDRDKSRDIDTGEPSVPCWLQTSPHAKPDDEALAPVRAIAVRAYGEVRDRARRGDSAAALAALSRFRLLCARRTGSYGAERWTQMIGDWLLADDPWRYGDRAIGRPLLITVNDPELGLANGDCGVIVAGHGAVFDVGGSLREYPPARLSSARPLYAMTIHKSQGSQFDTVVVVLPEPDSPTLTRELLYTAVTRARSELLIVGCEQSLRGAVERPVMRASGLSELLRA